MKVDSFTPVERLCLVNQFRILEKLDENEAKYYSKAIGILQGGYTQLYGELFHSISEEMPAPRCEFVFSVLDMHRALRDSFNELSDKEGLQQGDVAFKGFDGNYEPDEQCFALFMKEHDMWKDTLNAPGTPDDLNSHHSTLDRYRQMLDKWGQLPEEERRNLTAAQIKAILPYWKAQKD
jgi:uncharacterized protein YfbU (UPF0304 family)